MDKKNPKQKETANPPPKIKYEDTVGFKVWDHLMWSNRGARVECQ